MQIFATIKKNFDDRLAIDAVAEKVKEEIGERKFKHNPQIETTISKLRVKYNWLKNKRKKSSNGKVTRIGTNTRPSAHRNNKTYAVLKHLRTIDDVDHVDYFEDDGKSSHNEGESTLGGIEDLSSDDESDSEKNSVTQKLRKTKAKERSLEKALRDLTA